MNYFDSILVWHQNLFYVAKSIMRATATDGENVEAQHGHAAAEMSESEYREYRRAQRPGSRRQRDSFGDVFNVESYMGPWAGHLDRASPTATEPREGRVVSKQNIKPGREYCKMEGCSLRGFFRPVAAPVPSHPDKMQTVHYHRDRITGLTFFRRYDFLMSCSLDGRVVISRGLPLRTFMGHGTGIVRTGLSFDEAGLVSASYDGWIKRWDIESGRCRESVRAAGSIAACCIQDRHAVVGGVDGTVSLVDISSNSIVYSVAESKVRIQNMARCDQFICITRVDGSIEFREACTGNLAQARPGTYRSVLFDRGCGSFVADNDSEIHMFSNFSVCGRWGIEDQTTGLCIRANSTDVAYGNGRGEIVFAKEGVRLQVSGRKILCLGLSSRDCRSIAVGHSDGQIDIHS